MSTNLQKAQFFAARARTTQNKIRRERFLRAAWRYALAAAKELKASLEAAAQAAGAAEKKSLAVGNPTLKPTSQLAVSS